MSTPITLTGAYTCTHHNDKQRAACPVCLVTALTTERDQLRTELAEWQASAHLKGEAIDSLLVECDRLRAEVKRLKADGAASAFVNMSCRAWLGSGKSSEANKI